MAFHIEIEPQAFEDLDALVTFIKGESSFETAEKWLRGMLRSIHSLEQMPALCPIADESKALAQEVRVLLHGTKGRAYKIYFAIKYDTPETGAVRIFHVRHWARHTTSSDELQDLMDEFAD